jgi:uncharacterized protein YbcI
LGAARSCLTGLAPTIEMNESPLELQGRTSAGLLTASHLPGDHWEAGTGRQMDTDHSERSRQAKAVGNAVTRLHRDRYGRGATTTRTVFHGNRMIVFLEDIYTPAERTLIDAGSFEQVKATRQSFQMAMHGPFTEAVEEVTGRKVIAFMSQVHRDPDMAVEIFVLEESGEETPADQPRGELAPDVAETA